MKTPPVVIKILSIMILSKESFGGEDVTPQIVGKGCEEMIVSEKNVHDFIFANYSKHAKPRRNFTSPVEVALTLTLYGIHDFLERESVLVLNGFINLYWFDEYLRFDTKFPCIEQIRAPAKKVWKPDVALINSPDDPYSLITNKGQSVLIYKSGFVDMWPAGQFRIHCETDLFLFPFDQQVCVIRFESWMCPGINQQRFLFFNNTQPMVFDHWTDNKNWEVIGNCATIKQLKYFGGGDFDVALFYLVLKRKANFYVINIIVPSLIISTVEIVTFLIPIGDVIKIHISFTSLLAYSVFQAMVAEDLPRSSDSPLLCVYIDAVQAFICAALIVQGIVLFLIGKAEKGIPVSERIYAIFKSLARFLIVMQVGDSNKKSVSNGIQHFILTIASIMSPAEPAVEPKGKLSRTASSASSNGDQRNFQRWMLIARVVNRLNAICYAISIFGTPAIMFLFIPIGGVRPKFCETHKNHSL